jgi:hypothetical protein
MLNFDSFSNPKSASIPWDEVGVGRGEMVQNNKSSREDALITANTARLKQSIALPALEKISS